MAHPLFCTKMVLFKDKPLEDIPRRFDPGGCRSAMTMPPRVVKLSAAQVRQPLRTKNQVPEEEVVTKVSANEKKNAEPITEDKKAEQKNDEKKSPARRKVKMRKRKQWEKVADLSDQLREEQEIAEVTKQQSDDQRQHVYLGHFEEKRSGQEQQNQQTVEFRNEDKGLFSERNSWFVALPYTRLRAEGNV